MRILPALCAMLLLTGCSTWSLAELRQTEPKSTAFGNALSKFYLAYAESEAEQYDWYAAKYFADKGLMAAYGKEVPPEILGSWDIPADAVMELNDARQKVLAKLSPEFIAAEPVRAAHIQYLFDCWVEQQEENWQQEDIGACRDGLYDMLGEHAAKAEEPAPQPESTSYVVLFPWDEYRVTGVTREEVVRIADEILAMKDYEIVINGHTDRSGSEEYNLELSRKRAEHVQKTLIEKGIPESLIHYFAFGETDPSVPTADGVQEPANRRVEIFVE